MHYHDTKKKKSMFTTSTLQQWVTLDGKVINFYIMWMVRLYKVT